MTIITFCCNILVLLMGPLYFPMVLTVLLFLDHVSGSIPGKELQFPDIFSGQLQITSHQVDRNRKYPPWLTIMDISYDRTQLKVAVQVRKGFDEGKAFIRRYDLKQEYMVRSGEYAECMRSYLGEKMPLPQIPDTAVYQGHEIIDGVKCEHWLIDEDQTLIHIYTEVERKVPLRLHEETEIEGVWTPMISYDFTLFKTEQIPESAFDLPEGYEHDTCTRHVGGFPYIHAFRHYLMF